MWGGGTHVLVLLGGLGRGGGRVGIIRGYSCPGPIAGKSGRGWVIGGEPCPGPVQRRGTPVLDPDSGTPSPPLAGPV